MTLEVNMASKQLEDTTTTTALSGNDFDTVHEEPVSTTLPLQTDDFIPLMSNPGPSLFDLVRTSESLPPRIQRTSHSAHTELENTLFPEPKDFNELRTLQRLAKRSILLPPNRILADEAAMGIIEDFMHGRYLNPKLHEIVPSQILPLASTPYIDPALLQFGEEVSTVEPSTQEGPITMDWTHTILHFARVSFSYFCHPDISTQKRYRIIQALNELFMRYRCKTGAEVPEMQDVELESLIVDPCPDIEDRPRCERRWHRKVSQGIEDLLQRQRNGEFEPATDIYFSVADQLYQL